MEVKGILHCHSNYSYDADLTLGELKRLCIKQGLSFVCLTEHTDEMTEGDFVDFLEECDRLTDESFCFVPGFEVPYKQAHILMVGQRNFHMRYAKDLQSLQMWTKDAPFVVLAHPVRNKFEVEDGLLEQIDAVEVWNQQYEGKLVPRTRSLELYRTLKILKPELIATGGVDLHRKEHMGTPTITLDISTLTENNIIEKLKTGAFAVSSTHARFYGTLPDVDEIKQKYWVKSLISVFVIVLGKFVNKLLATFGLRLPSWLKQLIRRRV